MKQPDILIYLSDQHSPLFSSWGMEKTDTPNLEEIIKNGTNFTECYTSCPLCVPARMSMLSGKLPSKTGIYSNFDTLADMTPTFLHPLVEAGYETVLAGRMHFLGREQRHGFSKRLAGDITPVTWIRPTEKFKQERGVFAQTFGEPWCLDVIGGGKSPVLSYDEMVVDSVLRYLEEDHEKPQLILVGTYGPHFPYVAPPELYLKYHERVRVPDTFVHSIEMNPYLEKRKRHTEYETCKKAMAAYCGMVEHMDMQIGKVQNAFKEYCRRKENGFVFCYLSDHGDQVGEHRMFGKQTFFEKSAKIPMMFEGSMIQRGIQEEAPASIMDLGPTVCGLAGAVFDIPIDGTDLSKVLTGEEKADETRGVVSEFMETDKDGNLAHGFMVRKGQLKYIRYHGCEDMDMLFDLAEDKRETRNIIKEYPVAAGELGEFAATIVNSRKAEQLAKEHERMMRWMTAYEKETGGDDAERWSENPPDSRNLPEIQ